MLGILRDFRTLIAAVQQLVLVIQKLAQVQEQIGPATERLDALELSRFKFEAEVAGTLLKAEGKLKAANNAEARERQLKRSYERLADEGDLESEAGAEAGQELLDIDAQASQAERVPAVHLDVAPNKKAVALRAKWS